MTSPILTSIIVPSPELLKATGSSPFFSFPSQQLLAMGFSQIGRLAVGGIIAWNMAALPTVGTSPMVLDRRMAVRLSPPPAPKVSHRPTAEQLQIIGQVLSLSKSELARVMRITRPPLYDWIKGKSVPKDENVRRLNSIAMLVDEVLTPDERPLFSTFVSEPIEPGASSILEYLQQENLDQAALGALLGKARALTTQRDLRLAAMDREARQKETSAEAQQALLDVNLTLQEWDKVLDP